MFRRTLLALVPCAFASVAYADQFHYNNILIGDRALGLGGAYGAMSDDASGVFYNPAGLAFALSNDVSGSANAFYSRELVYKEAVGGQDFTEESGGSLPSFFGGLQKLDNISPGLVFAFGIYTTDADLKDQDDIIVDTALTPTAKIHRFHRTVNQRANTFFAAAGVGKRISNRVSFGFGLGYKEVNELVQEYQDVVQTVALTNGQQGVQIRSQNIRQHLKAYGVQAVFGIQWAVATRLSLGLTLKAGKYVSQSLDIGADLRQNIISSSDWDTIAASGSVAAGAQILQVISEDKNDNPLGSMPNEVRFGAAWFYSTRLVMSLDVNHIDKVEDAGEIETFQKVLYNREAVTNYALGAEYYMVPAVPVRVGVFTNNDARPEIDKNKPAQADHIDYLGGSLFFAWVQPNSQIAAGAILQSGEGEAQKLGDKTVQKIEAWSQTLAFSATHSF